LSAKTALVSVLLTPAGLLFTVFASDNLHMTPFAISALIVISAVAGGTSYLAGGYLSDRFGRRWPAIALTAATAISTSLSFASGLIGFVVGNLLWSAVASAATPIFGAWSAELFPTRARATAEVVGSVAFAIGGIAGLQAVGVLSQPFGLGGAIALVGVAALAGAFLLFLLPETKQLPLPD
jgi:DHA1 family bicyclomycin/chloramphenicol resistance-like MFS transporter